MQLTEDSMLKGACYAQFQLHVFIAEEYQSSFVCLQLSLFILFCAKTLTTFKINEEKYNRSILKFLRVKFLSIITDKKKHCTILLNTWFFIVRIKLKNKQFVYHQLTSL